MTKYVFKKREEEAEIFAANVFAFRLQDGDGFAFFLSNPVDSRGKVTTNTTNKRSDRM